jgi:nucleoside-diphosphate-sugar epimerase
MKRVLITAAGSRLGRQVAEELKSDFELRLVDGEPIDYSLEADFHRGSLTDPDFAWQAVRGVDAVIHTGEPPEDLPNDPLQKDQCLLDMATRGTFVLFAAAVKAGVKQFIYGSTMDIFEAYADDLYITENFKPLPSEEMGQMSRYFGEQVAREFARDCPVSVTALRLGRLVEENQALGEPPDLMWLDYRDAARAFRCALSRDTSGEVHWTDRFHVYHVCAEHPNGKYLIGPLKSIGFEPKHNFERHWESAVGAGR